MVKKKKKLLWGFSLDTAHIRIMLLTLFHQKHGASSFFLEGGRALFWLCNEETFF